MIESKIEKFRILVVDDEAKIQEMLKRHFTFLGYAVKTADNGEKALEILAKAHHHIIITDIKMPVMNGMELIKQVKINYPMTHCIVITGFVSLNNILACIRYGADTCIYKPIEDMEELERAVEMAARKILHWQVKLRDLLKMKEEDL